MPEVDSKSIEVLLEQGRAAAGPQIPQGGNAPYVLVPEGYEVQSLAQYVFNEHRPAPERMIGTIEVLDPASFVEYYTLFSDANSRVFAYEPDTRVTGILDYHGAREGGPRWCQHRLVLTLRRSEEWNVWKGSNGTHFNQQEFSEFLEQNATDITSPSPATMTEVARDLQATTEVEFGSGLRMPDGQVKFKYTETTTATVGAGQISVPERFTIRIPVFIGGDVIDMQALLRFRTKEGKLVFWYTLVRPEEVTRSAFLTARNSIESSLKIAIINGKA